MGFPCGSAGKESTCNAGGLGLITGLGYPGEGKGYPHQYSGLENSMDYSPWGRKELDTTEQFSLHFTSQVLKSIVHIIWRVPLKDRFHRESESCSVLSNSL